MSKSMKRTKGRHGIKRTLGDSPSQSSDQAIRWKASSRREAESFVHDCFQSFLKDYNLLPPSTPAPPTGSKKGVVSLDSLSVTWHSESCARVVYLSIY